MKIYILSFSEQGDLLSLKLGEALKNYELFRFSYKATNGIKKAESDVYTMSGEAFSNADALVFIGATGIAVRAISPHIKSKDSDIAVIAMDEKANFVIPLLSGHIGGANALSQDIAKKIGAQCVITTATDVNELFAIDTWASKNDMHISPISNIKHINSAVLAGEEIYVNSEISEVNIKSLPKGFTPCSENGKKLGVNIALCERSIFENTLNLIPRIVCLGIGCRRGAKMEDIEKAVFETLAEHNISIHAIKKIASLDIKSDEKGLLAFAVKYKKSISFFSMDELLNTLGSVSVSSLVQAKVGLDNVCERAALASAKSDKLLIEKTIRNSVTVAAAKINWSVEFEC